MPPEDLNNDPGDPGQQNALEGNWYDPLVGEDTARAELFSQYESPDKFIELMFFESENRANQRLVTIQQHHRDDRLFRYPACRPALTAALRAVFNGAAFEQVSIQVSQPGSGRGQLR